MATPKLGVDFIEIWLIFIFILLAAAIGCLANAVDPDYKTLVDHQLIP